jgi:hypothetical protein
LFLKKFILKKINIIVELKTFFVSPFFYFQIVKDPLFELFITLCIVLNTTFLAIEHHGMSQTVKFVLDSGNKVFTLVFTLECILKVMALSKDFFQCGWNIFDLLIVTASILDLIFELLDGLSVLRGLRLVIDVIFNMCYFRVKESQLFCTIANPIMYFHVLVESP